MPPLGANARQLLDVLRNQLLPWAGGGSPVVLLCAPPKIIGTNRITASPGPVLPLKTQRLGHTVGLRHWKEENFNSITVPYLSCVVEGEADLVVGTTTSMCRKMKINGTRWIVQMPRGSFSLAVPGIPFSAGQRVHWQRPYPEKAYSRILHLQVHETGAYCHFSTSDKGKLWVHPYTFVPNPTLLPLANDIIREMTSSKPQYLPVVYSYLTILLNYLVRSLQELPHHPAVDKTASANVTKIGDSPNISLQRALDYINEHLKDPTLCAEGIATHAYLSVTHLNRLFHQEFEAPVMRFVTRRRMELSRQLLVDSTFNINQISLHCGYLRSSSFIKAFLRHHGVSPVQYRGANHPDG